MCTETNYTMALLTAVFASLITIIATAIFKVIARSKRYRGDLISHSCATEMSHSFGRSVQDSNSNSGEVWEHNNDPTTTDGSCTIYGHYKNDFFEPGRYRITFRLLINAAKSTDPEIMRLNVLRWDGNVEVPIRERSLTGRDLAVNNGKYQNYEVECYVPSSGGKWEYRVFVNRTLWANNHLVIKFDTITISHNSTIWDGFLV